MRVRGRLAGTPTVVDVVLTGERIEHVEPASDVPADLGGSDVLIAPAFWDLQINGYKGLDFNSRSWSDVPASPAAVRRIAASLAALGVGYFCPTIVTNAPEQMAEGCAAVAAACREDASLAARIPGIHLEGPFLSPVDGPRGAHPLEHIREPDWDFFATLQDAADGRIKLVTLAPERPGAMSLIERLVAGGVIVSIGHSDAEPDDIRRAVDAGATMSTHLGNGAHAMIRRHPNYIWEQLACDDLVAGVIADLEHLPASVLRCFARVKGADRLCLVSDAVLLGGLPPGLYNDGRHEVLPSGRVNLAGTPYLAGAGHCLDTALANAFRCTELGEAGVIRTVTETPARVMGLAAEAGRVQSGYRADLALFAWPAQGPVRVQATILGGQVVHRA